MAELTLESGIGITIRFWHSRDSTRPRFSWRVVPAEYLTVRTGEINQLKIHCAFLSDWQSGFGCALRNNSRSTVRTVPRQ